MTVIPEEMARAMKDTVRAEMLKIRDSWNWLLEMWTVALRSMSFQTSVDPLVVTGSSLEFDSGRLKLTSVVGRALVTILASDTGIGAAEMSHPGA